MALRPNLRRMARDRFNWCCISTTLAFAAVALLIGACGGGGTDAVEAASPDSRNRFQSATLTWDPVNDPGLSGYRVYYGTAPGQYLQAPGHGINVGNVTTYTLDGLNAGTRYYFSVTAFDMWNIESGFSNEVFKDIS
jgi:hypothetical protein